MPQNSGKGNSCNLFWAPEEFFSLNRADLEMSFIYGINFLFSWLNSISSVHTHNEKKKPIVFYNILVLFELKNYFAWKCQDILILRDGSYNKKKKNVAEFNVMKLVKWWQLILCIQWRMTAKIWFLLLPSLWASNCIYFSA